jgi:hypothetical protein
LIASTECRAQFDDSNGLGSDVDHGPTAFVGPTPCSPLLSENTSAVA